MKKAVAVVISAVVAAAGANAEILDFGGTASASCTFSNNSPGQLSITGTSLSSSTDASVQIDNNSAGAYNIVTNPVTALAQAPNGMSLNGNGVATYQFTAGSTNATSTFTGDDESGYIAGLPAAGTDVLRASIAGTLNQTALAGTYQIQAVVNCVAI